MSVPRRIAAYLELAGADASAAIVLATAGNRYAAYHCQQAVEKLLKAILLHQGIEAGVEHHLNVLIDKMADRSPWQARIRPLEGYSPFATSWRYPTPGGRIPVVPDLAQVERDARQIDALVRQARVELVPPASE